MHSKSNITTNNVSVDHAQIIKDFKQYCKDNHPDEPFAILSSVVFGEFLTYHDSFKDYSLNKKMEIHKLFNKELLAEIKQSESQKDEVNVNASSTETAEEPIPPAIKGLSQEKIDKLFSDFKKFCETKYPKIAGAHVRVDNYTTFMNLKENKKLLKRYGAELSTHYIMVIRPNWVAELKAQVNPETKDEDPKKASAQPADVVPPVTTDKKPPILVDEVPPTSEQPKVTTTSVIPFSDITTHAPKELKYRKSHPRRDWVAKKIGVPTGAMLLGTGITYGLIIAANMVAGTGFLIPVTASPVANFLSTLSVGVMGGVILTPAIIAAKNALTKLHYNLHYGNVKKILKKYEKDFNKQLMKANEAESNKIIENGNASIYEKLSITINDRLGKLQDKISASHEKILALRSGKAITAPFRALARTAINVVNRNRIHHIQKTAIELVDIYNSISSDNGLINKRGCQRSIYSSLEKIRDFMKKDLQFSRDYIRECPKDKIMVENTDIYAEMLMTINKDRPKKLAEILVHKREYEDMLMKGKIDLLAKLPKADESEEILDGEEFVEVDEIQDENDLDNADNNAINNNHENKEEIIDDSTRAETIKNYICYCTNKKSILISDKIIAGTEIITFYANNPTSSTSDYHDIQIKQGTLANYCADKQIQTAVQKVMATPDLTELPECPNLAFVIASNGERVFKFEDTIIKDIDNVSGIQLFENGQCSFTPYATDISTVALYNGIDLVKSPDEAFTGANPFKDLEEVEVAEAPFGFNDVQNDPYKEAPAAKPANDSSTSPVVDEYIVVPENQVGQIRFDTSDKAPDPQSSTSAQKDMVIDYKPIGFDTVVIEKKPAAPTEKPEDTPSANLPAGKKENSTPKSVKGPRTATIYSTKTGIVTIRDNKGNEVTTARNLLGEVSLKQILEYLENNKDSSVEDASDLSDQL